MNKKIKMKRSKKVIFVIIDFKLTMENFHLVMLILESNQIDITIL